MSSKLRMCVFGGYFKQHLLAWVRLWGWGVGECCTPLGLWVVKGHRINQLTTHTQRSTDMSAFITCSDCNKTNCTIKWFKSIYLCPGFWRILIKAIWFYPGGVWQGLLPLYVHCNQVFWKMSFYQTYNFGCNKETSLMMTAQGSQYMWQGPY